LTPGEGQDLLARFKHAREQRDPDAMLELYREDAEYSTDPFEAPLEGANAIRAHWNTIASEQVHVDLDAERVWVSGSTVLASWHGAFTRAATAERIRVRGFSTFELDAAGLIARMRDWPLSRVVGVDSTHAPTGAPAEAGE
jgi:hypothetical protein